MSNAIISIMQSLPHADTVPEWLHLIPSGTFSGADGRGPYVVDDFQALMANSLLPGRKLPLDINHAIDLIGAKGSPSPAVGWIVELQAREDGLWGKAEWTENGRAIMQGKEYGYLSPVMAHNAKPPFKVSKLLRAALTNDPNLTLTSLHQKQNQTGESDMEEELRKALGLPESADQAAIIAAATTAATAVTAMSRVNVAAGIKADASADELVTAIQSRVKTGDDAEKTALESTITSLQSQITTLTNAGAKDRAEAVITKAIEDGKIVPALRDRYITRHMKDPADVEAEIKLLPSLHSGGLGNRRFAENGDPLLSDDDSHVIELMGVDPAAFSATAKSLNKEAK